MTFMDIMKKMVSKKEPEVYTPQREYIDRRHDNLQRQMSFYEKKRQIPIMEARIKQMEREQFGNGLKPNDSNSILKAPNHFKARNDFKWNRGKVI